MTQATCSNLLDPLIEHPPLIILLDLVLLKPRVYLHLLFNRGAKPFDADNKPKSSTIQANERDAVLWNDLFALGGVTVAAETATRLTSHADDTDLGLAIIGFTLFRVTAEMVAQHTMTLGLALLALWVRGWYPSSRAMNDGKARQDGRQLNFM